MHLPLDSFEKESPNGMLSRITSDAEYASKPFYAAISIFQILLAIMSLGAAAPKNIPQAFPFLLVTVILAVLTIIVSAKICSRAITVVQSKIADLTNHYTEQFANIRFIKACNAEQKAIDRSLGLIEQRYKAALYNAFATGLQTLANNFTYIIIYSCAFLGGILAISAGAISDTTPITEVYSFGIALELMPVTIMTLPSYFAAAVGGSKKLVSVFAMEEEDTTTGNTLDTASSDITLKDVRFGYSDTVVIDQVSAVIPHGKVTAILGPNGSGKSTLIKLIDRLYPIESGDLLIGSQRAADISLESWRKQFSVVSQNTALFSGTIRSNICYGLDREVCPEELDRVIALANLKDVLSSRPGGLDYEIGINGTGLSGGEQQRVAIARALLRDPQILLLDEATANLDTKTEAEVKKGLNELMKGRTVLQIAHNYSAIKDADHVIVLDHGKIAASGSPQELETSNSFFKQFVHSNCNI